MEKKKELKLNIKKEEKMRKLYENFNTEDCLK